MARTREAGPSEAAAGNGKPERKLSAKLETHVETGEDVSAPVTLKVLAARLNLDPATVSVVLNNVPGRSIPERTRERIRTMAREMNYHPSYIARSLRNRRTMMVGILTPVLSEGYHSEVMNGIFAQLIEQDYFNFIATHRHRAELVAKYPGMMQSRGAEGILAIDTHLAGPLPVPAVSIAGHTTIAGVTNVLLDHNEAARLTLRHLYDLGHRSIAFMHGHPDSSDSDTRWEALQAAAQELGIAIDPALTIHIDEDRTTPELGYPVVERLLGEKRKFTAMVCFNDVAAIGVIRALHDAHIRVPEDVSVMGFDDVPYAAFHSPRLTTIRQPLAEMGALAARLLVEQMSGSGGAPKAEVMVAPELIVRESTGAVARRG